MTLEEAQLIYDGGTPDEREYCSRCDKEIFNNKEYCEYCQDVINQIHSDNFIKQLRC
jgi:hypothetical protein